MRSLRAIGTNASFVLVTFAALAGCSGGSATTAPTESAQTVRSADTEAQARAAGGDDAGREHGHRPPHGGPDFLVRAALHENLNLTADQKTAIEAIEASSKPAGPSSAQKSRMTALAAGIRAGKVDGTMVAHPDDAEMAAHRAAAATALTKLHDTLTAAQRRTLVDALAKREAEHENDGPDAKGPPQGHADGPPPGEMGHGPMEHLLEGLDVTAAQKDAIHAKLEAARPAPPSDAERAAMHAQHEAMRTAMQAKLETFAGDTFDATAFVTPPAGAMKPGDHPDRMVAEISAIVSVLDAGQREKLAARIEAGPPAGHEH